MKAGETHFRSRVLRASAFFLAFFLAAQCQGAGTELPRFGFVKPGTKPPEEHPRAQALTQTHGLLTCT